MSIKAEPSDPHYFQQIHIGPSTVHSVGKTEVEPKINKEQPLKELLPYINSKRGQLFLKFIELGILDKEGNLSASYSNVGLPFLTYEESKVISEELEKHFLIEVDEKYRMETSIASLLRSLFDVKNAVACESVHLVGGYVRFLLFTKTNYAKRVFETLKILDLYDEELFKKASLPPDFDLKIGVRNVSEPYDMNASDLKYIRNQLTNALSYWFVKNFLKIKIPHPFSQEVAQVKIDSHSFKEPPLTIDSGFNRFQLVSFKNTPFELNFFNALTRHYVFTLDDLSLNIATLIFRTRFPIFAESTRKKPLESFFHMYLGLIKCEKIETIDDRGLFRLNSLSAKGYFPISFYEMTLCKRANEGKKLFDREKMEKWIRKHFPNNGLEAFTFVFNTCRSFRTYFPSHDTEIAWGLVDPKTLKNPLAFLIFELICNLKVPLEIVDSFLQVACFLNAAKKIPANKEMGVAIGCAATDPCNPILLNHTLELQIEDQTLKFDFDPCLHLEAVKRFIESDKEGWKKIEPSIIKLYSLLIPPHEATAFQIPYNLSFLEKPLLSLLSSSSPFLQSVALQFYFSSNEITEKKKQALAERHLLNQFNFSEDKRALKKQFDLFIEKNDLTVEDPDFEKKWISFLFQSGRNTEATAYEVWKEWFEKSQDVIASFSFIKQLSYTQPEYALRLFTYLKIHNKLTPLPSESYEAIMSFLQVMSHLGQRSERHNSFVDYLGEVASKLLDESGFKPSQKKNLFSKSFLIFGQWFLKKDRKLTSLFLDVSLKRNYLTFEDRKSALFLQLETKVIDLTHTQSIGPDKVKEVFADIRFVNLSDETRFQFLLTLLKSVYKTKNSNNLNPDVFKDFLEVISADKFGQKGREEALEIIVLTLETLTLLSNSFLVRLKDKIETSLKVLFTLDISYSLRKRVLTQCCMKKLALPNEELYLNTLIAWCYEKESDKSETTTKLEKVFSLFSDLALRGCQKTELMRDVRVALVENGIVHPAFQAKCILEFEQIPISIESSYTTLVCKLLNFPQITERVKFDWVERIHKKEPNIKPFLLKSVFTLCKDILVSNDKGFEDLIFWASKTKFFDGFDEENKSLVNTILWTVFSEGVSKQCDHLELPVLEALCAVYSRYVDTFEEDADISTFHDFLSLIDEHFSKKLFDLYSKFKTLKFLTNKEWETEELVCLQNIECIVLKKLIELDDPRALTFVTNFQSNLEAFNAYPNQLMRYYYFCNLLRVISHFFLESDEKDALLVLAHAFYTNGKSFQTIIIKENLVEEKDVPLFLSYCGLQDFAYLSTLALSGDELQIKKFKSRLAEIQNSLFPSSYWNVSALVINDLILISNPNEHVVSLVEFLTKGICETNIWLNLDNFFPFIFRWGKLESFFKLAKFWYTHLGHLQSNGVVSFKVNKTNWEHGKKILDVLIVSPDPNAATCVSQMILKSLSFRNEFAKTVEGFDAQLAYYRLMQNINMVKSETSAFFFYELKERIKNLSEYYPFENRLLKAIETAITVGYYYDRENFYDSLALYWHVILVESKQNRNEKNKLRLSEDQCYAIKADLIKNLFALHVLNEEDKALRSAIKYYAIKLENECPKKHEEFKKLQIPK